MYDRQGYHIGRPGLPPTPRIPIIVKLVGGAYTPPGEDPISLGGGRYVGKKKKPPKSTDIGDLTGSLGDDELGRDGSTVLLFNAWEVGKTTHLLDASLLPLEFIGIYLCNDQYGTEIYMIDGQQGGC